MFTWTRGTTQRNDILLSTIGRTGGLHSVNGHKIEQEKTEDTESKSCLFLLLSFSVQIVWHCSRHNRQTHHNRL